MDLAPLNLGMIAAYYYITYTTIELFAQSLTAKTKTKGVLEIISAASEFDTLSSRPGEELTVEKLLKHAPVSVDKPRYSDPHTKANALLQAHFSRAGVAGDLRNDQQTVVREAVRLLQVGEGRGGQLGDFGGHCASGHGVACGMAKDQGCASRLYVCIAVCNVMPGMWMRVRVVRMLMAFPILIVVYQWHMQWLV